MSVKDKGTKIYEVKATISTRCGRYLFKA